MGARGLDVGGTSTWEADGLFPGGDGRETGEEPPGGGGGGEMGISPVCGGAYGDMSPRTPHVLSWQLCSGSFSRNLSLKHRDLTHSLYKKSGTFVTFSGSPSVSNWCF